MGGKLNYYSDQEGEMVYHNHTSCPEGSKIKNRYYQIGTDKRILCRICQKIKD